MNMIVEWVMQIIVFILLGTLVELLLPNNVMKKYVNIVIGLLLLFILAKPILYLFSVDVTSQLERMEQAIFEDEATFEETETLLEKQKKDIQAEQDAYIWNEVKLQLIKEANPTLLEKYSVTIDDISFHLDGSSEDKYDNLETVIVTMQTNGQVDKKKEEKIKPIIIETTPNVKEKDRKETNTRLNMKIEDTLEEIWGLDKGKIHLDWEGGTS